MSCTSVTAALCLVLTIYTVSANIVPKRESEIMQFPKPVENNLGSQCQFDGLQGVCTEMGNCGQYVRAVGAKADNDPCLNVRHTMVICCSKPAAAPKRTRAETSSEESSTDSIGNE